MYIEPAELTEEELKSSNYAGYDNERNNINFMVYDYEVDDSINKCEIAIKKLGKDLKWYDYVSDEYPISEKSGRFALKSSSCFINDYTITFNDAQVSNSSNWESKENFEEDLSYCAVTLCETKEIVIDVPITLGNLTIVKDNGGKSSLNAYEKPEFLKEYVDDGVYVIIVTFKN